MKVKLLADTRVLIPNKEHKNFTETTKVLLKGTELEGEFKCVEGKRKGEPFTYKIFETKDKQIIYIKNVKPMNTEVTLGFSGEKMNTRKMELFTGNKRNGLLLGAAIGFAYSKFYKKNDLATAGKHALIFGAVGYIGGYIMDKNTTLVVKK